MIAKMIARRVPKSFFCCFTRENSEKRVELFLKLGFFYVFSLEIPVSRFRRVPGAPERCQDVLLPPKIHRNKKIPRHLFVSPRNSGLNVFEKGKLWEFPDTYSILRCRGEYIFRNVGKILSIKTCFLTNSPMV